MVKERRLTIRLAQYWDDLRKNDPLPDMARFNPDALDDVKPHMLILKIIKGAAGTTTYQYEYMGKELIQAYGTDLTGEYVNANMHNFPGARILKRVDEVVVTPRFVVDDGQFISKTDKIVRYRACLLPFGKAKDQPSHIVAGISWTEH